MNARRRPCCSTAWNRKPPPSLVDMVKPIFSKKIPVVGTGAMLILLCVAFVVPLLARGAKLSLENVTNNVADWLPSHFPETVDLREFRKYFYGDQFVVVSGDWCKEGDGRFDRLLQKLREESLDYEKVLLESGRHEEVRAHRKGDELGLMYTGTYHQDWGEQQEKWLQGKDKQWYFIKRGGELYRWEGQNNVVEGFQRWSERNANGRNKAEGTFIDQFGLPPELSNGEENPFYKDPKKLCCRPFKSVISGLDVFEQIGGENGTLRINKNVEDELSAFETQVEAHNRLTGSLFGLTPSPKFNWTFESLLQQVDDPDTLRSDPKFRDLFDAFVANKIETEFEGRRAALDVAPQDQRLKLWMELWLQLGLEPPPRQTCLVVTLNDPILSELDRAVGRPVPGKPRRGRILEIAISRCGISMENIRIGGPPADNVAIDEEGTSTLVKLIGYSAVLGILIAWVSFRSIRITAMLFFVGGVSAMGSLAIVWVSGDSMDAILMSMPSLVYVLGLSGAVHLVNYYRDACHEDGSALAAETAVKHCIFPCTLAASTTALGLYSLTTSSLAPIHKFGLYSAIATLGAILILFTFLPSALTTFKPGYEKKPKKEVENEQGVMGAVTRFWDRVGDWVIGNYRIVLGLALIVLMIGGWGISKIETQVHLLKLFDADAKILKDYHWLEENIGQLVPAEIVIKVDSDGQRELFERDDPDYERKLSMLERIEISNRVSNFLEKYFGPEGTGDVGTPMSSVIGVPLHTLGTQDNEIRRNLFSDRIYESRAEIRNQEYHAKASDTLKPIESHEDPELELWRISIRLAALTDVDYGKFIGDLKSVIEPVMSAYRSRVEILDAVRLDENSEKKSRVLVIGPDPDHYKVDIQQELRRNTPVSSLIDQTYIFGSTLKDLLANRQIISKGSKRSLVWRDLDYLRPDNPLFSESQRKKTEVIRERLNSDPDYVGLFDCVIVLKDHEAFDTEFIRRNAKNFVDCRDHLYLIDPESKQPLQGMLTAKERSARGEDIDVSAIYTGIVPIVYKAQRSLLTSLVQSILLAFAMISVVMMLLLRDWRRGLSKDNVVNFWGGMISMIPNVFPVVVVFGVMGMYGIKVDIGSMMTASVAMGIAVDDTIHYLTWYRQALGEGQTRKSAIKYAYDKVATAMTQTTLIGGLGLFAFAFSTFTPTQRFGTLMLFLLGAALIGDLIVLPAVIAHPFLGKFFGRELSDEERQELESGLRVHPAGDVAFSGSAGAAATGTDGARTVFDSGGPGSSPS